jgi:hypothetical protein
VNGLTEKLNHNSILGITDTETVKLDFDKTPFKTVLYWAFRTMKWFRLKGFIVLKSSENCYHVVFDCKVSWSRNVKVMAWVCLMSQHKLLTKWFIMQCIKQASTLRVSAKGQKPEPRVVFRYGSQENQIAEFLAYRKLVKDIMTRFGNENMVCPKLL